MIIITYNPTYGEAIADGCVDQIVNDIIEAIRHQDVQILNYATGNIFQALLLKIAQEIIQPEDISLRYVMEDEARIVEVNKYGAIPDWPDGFIDLETRVATKRLAIQARRQFEERRLRCHQSSIVGEHSPSENS